MSNDTAHGHGGNRLLAALTPEALAQLNPELVEGRAGDTLIEPESIPSHVFFPHRGTMISLVRTDESGSSVEVGLVGADGAVPLQSALASLPTRSEAMVQSPGGVTRISAEMVRQAYASDEAFRRTVLTYTSVYLDAVSQNALCNRVHPLEGRLAKWLLASHRVIGSREISLTHEFLSHMLGVRRPGVTIAVNTLTLDGLIAHARGAIVIADPEGLALRACECDRVLHDGWNRSMGQARS